MEKRYHRGKPYLKLMTKWAVKADTPRTVLELMVAGTFPCYTPGRVCPTSFPLSRPQNLPSYSPRLMLYVSDKISSNQKRPCAASFHISPPPTPLPTNTGLFLITCYLRPLHLPVAHIHPFFFSGCLLNNPPRSFSHTRSRYPSASLVCGFHLHRDKLFVFCELFPSMEAVFLSLGCGVSSAQVCVPRCSAEGPL